jgi:hypothetical protein
MALLDRFKAHPRHRHPDPAVRLAFVAELPIDEREQLAAMAREDEDPRVRRAAAAKLMDPAALVTVARDDRDEGVRSQAVDMLRDLALEAFEGAGEAESLAAVEALAALGDAKTLAVVAKSAAREGVAQAALTTVRDVKALGSIARHGSFEALRAAALGRVEDHGEILAVAMNSEFKDTALAALDRVSSREDLERVAERAKNKSAAKRARASLREMDERAAADAAAAAVAAVVEVPASDAPDALRAQIEETARALQRMQETDRAEAVRAQETEQAQADAEAARQREERQAVERQRAEVEAQKDSERRHVRLAELAVEAEAAAADADLASGRRRFAVAQREWKDLVAGLAAVEPGLAGRFAAADAGLTARGADAHEADARSRREALARVQQIAARVEPLAARADLSLKAGERALHELRATLADVPPLPSKREYDEIVRRLKAAQAALTPKVAELREAEDWKRFGNAGVQEQLCARMEGLRALEDPEALAKEIRNLQQEWRQVADVPRAQGEALWRRFKAAHDAVWPRCEAHFAAQNAARASSLAAKVALCERAEALAESKNWIHTAEEIKRLQAEWKTIGPVTRGQEKAIWDRFRLACDRFFTRRHEDLAQRKTMWAENYAKKEALAVQAETFAGSVDWDAAAAGIKRLQAEWKTIGPVKKTRSEAIWQRFRAACDLFFARYAQRHDIAKAERVAAREAICAELEELAQSPVSSLQSPVDGSEPPAPSPQPPVESPQPPADLGLTVRGLRSKWQREIAARGVDRDRAIALDDRFQAAFNGVLARWPSVFSGTELDPDANRTRMDALVKRVEDLAASLLGAPGAAADTAISPTTRLASMLKEALAANTIGGKVDEASRWRAAQEDVRQAQASWARIGPVAEATRRPLADRFARACRRITEGAGGARTALTS